jgi:hypothetical protein
MATADTDTATGVSPPRLRTRAKSRASSAAHLGFFADDPWNAMVVLGLRVYSKGEVKVRVAREEDEDSE